MRSNRDADEEKQVGVAMNAGAKAHRQPDVGGSSSEKLTLGDVGEPPPPHSGEPHETTRPDACNAAKAR